MRLYSAIFTYAVAVGSSASDLLLTLWLKPLLSTIISPLFYIAIIVSTWYGGFLAGMVTVICSVLALDYFFIAPVYQVLIRSPKDVFQLGVFLLVALVINFLTNNLQQSKRKIERLSQQTEIALRESEQKFRELAENTEDIFYLYTADYNQLLYINQAYEIIWQRTCQSLYQNPYSFSDSIHPLDRDRCSLAINRLLNGEADFEEEYRIIRPDGSIRWVYDRTFFIKNEAGEAYRIAGITTDITERKQAEIALQQFNIELEQRVADRTAELTQINTRLQQELNQRQMIEEALRQSENRFQQITATSPSLIYIYVLRPDGSFCFEYVSAAVEEILGFSVEEVLADANLLEWGTHPDDADGYLVAVMDSMVSMQPFRYEWRNYSRSGELKWLRANSRPERRDNGDIVWYGVLHDITDRKQAEEALLQKTRKEQLLFSITQAIRQSLALNAILNTTVTEVRQTLQANRAAIYRFNPDWSGYFVVESVSPGWPKLVDGDVQTVWEDTYLQDTQGGRFQNKESFIVNDIYKAQLQLCHLQLLEQFQARSYAAFPIFSGEMLWGLLAIYQNSTSRQWQSWEVELLQEITSQLSIAIHQSELYEQLQIELQERKQAEATIREAERRWRSLLNNVQLIVVGLDQWGTVNYVNPFFLRLTGYRNEEVLGKNWFENFLPPSAQQAIQTIFSDVLTDNAHPYYLNSISTKSGEERFIAWNNTMLQDSKGNRIGTISIGEDITERQRIEQIKDEFIGILSHELRTPLTAIQMSLGLLKTGIYDKKPEKYQRMIEIALLDTNRLVNLVNDMLDLERLESGQVIVNQTVCKAADLMQQAVDGIQAIATQQQVSLRVAPSDAEVLAVADSIIQTLTNLLSNGIKFSPPQSTIHLSAEAQTDYVLFKVSDQGRGIPADKLDLIFGRFQQVDVSDSRQKGGTGLGLAICRSIIEQHGGSIWAESILGEGSTFFFTVPLGLIKLPSE